MGDLESGGLDLELEGLGEVMLVKEVKRGRMYENVEGVGGAVTLVVLEVGTTCGVTAGRGQT